MKSIVAVPFLVLLAACSSSPWREYRFQPSPLETLVTSEHVPQATVRALASVIGIAKSTDEVRIRLRLENLGSRGAKLVEGDLSLVSADLVTFGKVRVQPASTILLKGEAGTYELDFAPPEQGLSNVDLHGINLRFTVDFDGQPVTTGATFQMDEWRTYAESPHVHFGVAWGHWD